MAIFNSYVSLPEGNPGDTVSHRSCVRADIAFGSDQLKPSMDGIWSWGWSWFLLEHMGTSILEAMAEIP